MSTHDELLEDTAEDLFEEAPCGYLTTELDGRIVKVNRTFEAWTHYDREELLGIKRLQDLLAPGSQIYHDTHYHPLLLMQGTVREIAVEFVRADGTRLPALINSVLRADREGEPRVIRTTVFDATDRRRYEQELLSARHEEHEIAQSLQRSLLAGELPRAEGFELDVLYRSGVEGLEVGGDWFDAFWLVEGSVVALTVGDVVGRGIQAAATMGQLRSAVRALATTQASPAEVLDALDEYAHRHGVGKMATVVYAQLDLHDGRVDFACAGHPPPLVVPAEGEVAFAWEGRSMPLEAHIGERSPRPSGITMLPPGASLVLYTDGLVETRQRSIQEGMDELRERAVAHRAEPISVFTSALVDGLHTSEHADDTCVLVARR